NSHLINFDTSVVLQNGSGLLKFEDLGTFTGRCFLNCHGEEHNPETY
ncbi:MAG: cytochrome C, partial [Nitrospirae bacterium CG08_land_8_20_14_0_20_52_24]